MHVEIIAPKPSTPGPPGGHAPGGMDSAQAWNFYSSALPGLATAQKNRFWDLYNVKMPKTITAGQLANWHKDQKVLFGAQSAMAGTRDSLLHMLTSPTGATPALWTRLQSQLTTLKNLEYGKTDPSWNWPAWHYQNATWKAANTATASMQADVNNAYAAWKSVYGAGGSAGTPVPKYGTPGVLVTPLGGSPAPVDLSSLIMGGPSSPVIGSGASGSATGMGFALGGMVGGGDGGSLADVAGMFSLGGQVQDPTLAALGLPPAAQRQLAGTAAGGMPRSLSDAAGDRIGVKIGNLTVHNPVAEKPSDTITRSTNRLAFLAGRGSV
jgi:hypothetical protein